ncbi:MULTISPECIES: hypothetical protein [Mycobacteriaceae]|uniref:hypothetical protein n=1 Tax=Mycobacteriaceae TaxID=1762 RepID=UPI000AC05C22|nr:hypothetical protein [Mycolicibacterium mucogenicum]
MLEMVVTWHPGAGGSSLRTGSRAIAPALLYADKLVVWSDERDHALEAADYFELLDVSEDIVEFEGLDSSYLGEDNVLVGLDEPANEMVVEWHSNEISKLSVDDVDGIWQHVQVMQDINRDSVIDFVFDSLLPRDYDLFSEILDRVRRTPYTHMKSDECVSEVLLANHIIQTQGRIGLLDDLRGNIDIRATQFGKDNLVSYAQTLNAQGSLGVGAIQRLPSIRQIEWTEVWHAREQLQAPLRRFRSATLELVKGQVAHPVDEEFAAFVDFTWQSKMSPAIEEVEELVREKSLRQMFFLNALGDLKTYAGPGIGIAVAETINVAGWVGASVGAATAAGKLAADFIKARREVAKHNFFYLYEIERRAAKALPE